jgi:hypothetical protein
MLGLGIMTIEEKFFVLELCLNILNVLFYLFVISVASFKDGQKALDIRETNDKKREAIAKTGQDIPLNLQEEYKLWKGFVYGAVSCAPMVILLILHALFSIGGGPKGFGMIGGILYMPVFSFVLTFLSHLNNFYYFGLLAIPVISLTTGLTYKLGADFAYRKYQSLAETRRFYEGE